MVRKRRPTTSTAIALAVVCCLTTAATAVVAEARHNRAPTMPLGAAAAAPDGFVALCRRAPDQCPTVGARPDLERMSVEANRRRWNLLFGRTPIAARVPAAAPDPSRPLLSDAPITQLISQMLELTLARGVLSADPQPTGALAAQDASTPAIEVAGDPLSSEAAAATDFATPDATNVERSVEGSIPVTDDPSEGGATFALDRQGWRTVNGINRRLNRSIRHVEDRDLHGEEDRWALPDAGLGDCEDYVLAKRVALIAAGVPAEVLSIAIVETPWGETHAVLLLASDRGEYVLDSLSPWVTRWDRVGYRWRERQLPGGGFDWASVVL